MSYPHGIAAANEVIAAAVAWRDSLIPNTSTANYHPTARLRDAVDRYLAATELAHLQSVCDHPRAQRVFHSTGRRVCGKCGAPQPDEPATPEPEPHDA